MKRLADHDRREVDGRKPRLDKLGVLVVDRRGKHGNIPPLSVKLGSVLCPPVHRSKLVIYTVRFAREMKGSLFELREMLEENRHERCDVLSSL